MEKFRTATYEVHNPKIKKKRALCCSLQTFTEAFFGEEKHYLAEKTRNMPLDAILLAGDMAFLMILPTGNCWEAALHIAMPNLPYFLAMETK